MAQTGTKPKKGVPSALAHPPECSNPAQEISAIAMDPIGTA